MTDEASASKAVSESLRLLTEDTMMDFTDFAIDSDDDQGQDGLNFDPLSGTPAAAQSDDKEKVDSPPVRICFGEVLGSVESLQELAQLPMVL